MAVYRVKAELWDPNTTSLYPVTLIVEVTKNGKIKSVKEETRLLG